MSAIKSAALLVGLSVIALSQATVPQIYVSSAIPGDKGRTLSTIIPRWPILMTRKDGLIYLDIDPAALAVTVQINGKKIGTTGTVNFVPGPGVILTAIDNPEAMTIQISTAGGCVPDGANPPNLTCPGNPIPTPK